MMFKKKFGIILVLCFIFIGLTGCGSNEEKAIIVDMNGNKVELSHSELMEEYNNNQTRFTNNYMAAKITVTGTIVKIENSNTLYVGGCAVGSNDLTHIELKNGWIVQVDDEHDLVNINELNVGDMITISSNIADVSGTHIYLAAFDGGHCAFGKTPTIITKK